MGLWKKVKQTLFYSLVDTLAACLVLLIIGAGVAWWMLG